MPLTCLTEATQPSSATPTPSTVAETSGECLSDAGRQIVRRIDTDRWVEIDRHECGVGVNWVLSLSKESLVHVPSHNSVARLPSCVFMKWYCHRDSKYILIKESDHSILVFLVLPPYQLYQDSSQLWFLPLVSFFLEGGQKCNTCGGHFPDAAAYRNHFRYGLWLGLFLRNISIELLTLLFQWLIL